MFYFDYLCFNSEFVRKHELIFSATNRGLKYGDSVFETLRANGKKPFYIDDHLARLKSAMRVFEMQIPENFDKTVKTDIERLLHRNRLYQGVRIRVTVFRNGGGLYTPEENSVSLLIEAEKTKSDFYTFNPTGLRVGFYNEFKKSPSPISAFKSSNSILFIKAGLDRKRRGLDDLILYNTDNYICEAISSNVFCVKNDVLYTPPLADGCVAGVLRKQVLRIAKEIGLETVTNISLTKQNLLDSDEIFLTNAGKGIQWIGAYEGRRFLKKWSMQLMRQLQNEIQQT